MLEDGELDDDPTAGGVTDGVSTRDPKLGAPLVGIFFAPCSVLHVLIKLPRGSLRPYNL